MRKDGKEREREIERVRSNEKESVKEFAKIGRNTTKSNLKESRKEIE